MAIIRQRGNLQADFTEEEERMMSNIDLDERDQKEANAQLLQLRANIASEQARQEARWQTLYPQVQAYVNSCLDVDFRAAWSASHWGCVRLACLADHYTLISYGKVEADALKSKKGAAINDEWRVSQRIKKNGIETRADIEAKLEKDALDAAKRRVREADEEIKALERKNELRLRVRGEFENNILSELVPTMLEWEQNLQANPQRPAERSETPQSSGPRQGSNGSAEGSPPFDKDRPTGNDVPVLNYDEENTNNDEDQNSNNEEQTVSDDEQPVIDEDNNDDQTPPELQATYFQAMNTLEEAQESYRREQTEILNKTHEHLRFFTNSSLPRWERLMNQWLTPYHDAVSQAEEDVDAIRQEFDGRNLRIPRSPGRERPVTGGGLGSEQGGRRSHDSPTYRQGKTRRVNEFRLATGTEVPRETPSRRAESAVVPNRFGTPSSRTATPNVTKNRFLTEYVKTKGELREAVRREKERRS